MDLPDRAAGPRAPLPAEAGLTEPAAGGLGKGLLLALAGLAGVSLGAMLLVDAAIAIARLWGLSEAVIGVTLVAIGTALPELATMLASAGHRRADVGFGNVIGSNLCNILGITGTAALVRPLAVPVEVAQLHVWIIARQHMGARVVRAHRLAHFASGGCGAGPCLCRLHRGLIGWTDDLIANDGVGDGQVPRERSSAPAGPDR